MRNILIVEDNSVMQKIMKSQMVATLKLLGEIDTNFLFATSCQEALEQVEAATDFYMIIMDGQLRGNADGVETFIKLCKKYPNLEEITVGWSSTYTVLDNWNEYIKLKYESADIRAEEKPDILPVMKYSLPKPTTPFDVKALIDSFENKAEKLESTASGRLSF